MACSLTCAGLCILAGNINQLILKADSYAAALEETQGIIAEFVNPKYKDDSRTAFKSSTRLECMMQDFPHGLPPDAAVGFTVINQACDSPEHFRFPQRTMQHTVCGESYQSEIMRWSGSAI